MSPIRYVRMVLWSFIGIGGGGARRMDLSEVRPLALIGVAVTLAGVFGLTVWGLANVAVQALGH
ncbi:MAG: DUF2970 domain-containing protein [Paucibacter sp.]|nr:DUF2970 domain-containing protein [Roseateles sp.]